MKVGVFGSGAIGLFFGAALSAAGHDVVFLVRPQYAGQVDRIRATLADGTELLPSGTARSVVGVEGLDVVDVCLITVKSDDTPDARDALAPVLGEHTLTLTLQNGLHNLGVLGERLPLVAGGSVGFNVTREGLHVTQTLPGALHLGSNDPRLATLAQSLREVGVRVEQVDDIGDVLAGKLLLNVNNGVCGATGRTIGEMMRSADARRVFAACLREGIAVLRAAGYTPAKLALLGPETLAAFLELPDFVVRPLLHVASIDAEADTSTTVDLRRGRKTEIGHLNGALVRLGRRHGVATPANALVTDLVRQHEREQTHETPAWVAPHVLRERLMTRQDQLVLPA